MGDQTTADKIVTAKAGTVVAEGKKLALATASGSLTPSTITAMVGIHNGSALKLAPTVEAANLTIANKINSLRSTGTNNPTLQLVGNITANIGDYLIQSLVANQITFSGPIKANVGEYVTQTTVVNRINFSNVIVATPGQYITQTTSGANAVVVATPLSLSLANLLSISYTTPNVFILSSGNVYIGGIDANVYPTNTSANITQFANAAVIPGNNSGNILFISYLNANVFTLSFGNIIASPWTGNVYLGGIDATVNPTITSVDTPYIANAAVLTQTTDSSIVEIRYVTRPNVFVLGSGNIQYSGNLTILDGRGNVILYPNISANAYPSSIIYPGDSDFANISQSALSNLKSLQDQILPAGNHAAFGAFLAQAQAHINDARDLRNTTNFISNSNFRDFGSGITNVQSLTDQGLTGTFGSLPAAGVAMTATGTMFNGIDSKNIGSPAGIVEALNNNKLANATGVNQKLVNAGVDLNDLNNPVYKTQISQVLSNTTDPASINTVADQFNINPYKGLPSYSGSDSSIYTNSASKLLGGS